MGKNSNYIFFYNASLCDVGKKSVNIFIRSSCVREFFIASWVRKSQQNRDFH